MNQLATVNNPPATRQRPSLLAALGSRYSVEPAKLLETLKATAFRGANDQQMMALCIVAHEYGLNPFTKQIYAFPDKGGGIVPVVGVDGWTKIMNEQASFDGIDFEYKDGPDGKPESCTAVIYIKDRSRPVRITEYYSECHRNTDPWSKSPRRMLRHKALIQGVRVAFGLTGIHDEDEGADIAGIKTANATEVRQASAPSLPPKRVEVVAETIPTPEEEVAATDRATPIEGLRNLCKASGVTEIQVLAFLKKEGACSEDVTALDQVEENHLQDLINSWDGALLVVKQMEVPTAESPLSRVRALLTVANIEESALLSWLKDKKHVNKTVTDLGAVNLMRLQYVVDNWAETILPALSK